jgi:hypothetical protein
MKKPRSIARKVLRCGSTGSEKPVCQKDALSAAFDAADVSSTGIAMCNIAVESETPPMSAMALFPRAMPNPSTSGVEGKVDLFLEKLAGDVRQRTHLHRHNDRPIKCTGDRGRVETRLGEHFRERLSGLRMQRAFRRARALSLRWR